MSAFVADALARIEAARCAEDLECLLRWAAWDPYEEPVDEPDFDDMRASWKVNGAAVEALACLPTPLLARSLLPIEEEVDGVVHWRQGASGDLVGKALLLRQGKGAAGDLVGMLASEEDHEAAVRAIDAATVVFSGRAVLARRGGTSLPLPPVLEALADVPLESSDSYCKVRLAWVRKELARHR